MGKCCSTKAIWRLAEITEPGILNREWHGTEPAIPISASTTAAGRAFRLGHDFTLPTTTNTIVNDLRLNDTDNTAAELDIQTLETVVTVPAGGIWLRYTGGSEGYWAIEVGECCGPLVLKDELGYQDREDNAAIVGPVFLPEGQHYLRIWNIDSGGSNSSHTDQYSTDGTNFSGALPTGVEFSRGKRATECERIPECDSIPEDWSEHPPTDCIPEFPNDTQTETGEGNGLDEAAVIALLPKPCTTIPIADNEVDTAIRTGQIGASEEFARCDHNHPIRRQANPGFPDVTLSGPATENFTQNRRFRSDEESITFTIRKRFLTTTDNGWVIYNIPNLGGFQVAEISCDGVYYQTGDQDDTGKQVANMEGRGVIWADIGRIYYGQFSGKETAETWWPNIKIKYTRL